MKAENKTAHDFGASSVNIDIALADERWRDMRGDINAHMVYLWRALDLGAGEISLLLANDERLAQLNEIWRGKSGATNVLAFRASEASGDYLVLGDVALSYERVIDEAKAAGIVPLHRALHLLTHGTLHLLGYTHDTEKTAQDMEAVEIELLAARGIDNPYLLKPR